MEEVRLCPEAIGQKFNILVSYLFCIPWYPTLTRGENRLAKIQILDLYLFDIPLEFGGLKCNGQPTNFLLPFSSLGSFLFSYLVPTYIRYLRRKTVVQNENLVGGAGV